jgi:hypothetical protein
MLFKRVRLRRIRGQLRQILFVSWNSILLTMKILISFFLFGLFCMSCQSNKAKQAGNITITDTLRKNDSVHSLKEEVLPALFEAIKNDTIIAGDQQTAYILSVLKTNEGLFLEADYMEFLMGDKAFEAAKKHHDLDTSYDGDGKMHVGILNDYYILNENTRTRRLRLYDKIVIEVFHWAEDTYYHTRISADSMYRMYKRYAGEFPERYTGTPFSLTLRNGEIVKITEIYVP